jgi:hypothetical protein
VSKAFKAAARYSRTINRLLWLYTLGPILILVIGAVVSSVTGYQPSGGGSRPQNVVLGVDIGPMLDGLVVFPFLAAVTVPSGLVAIAFFNALIGRSRRPQSDRTG